MRDSAASTQDFGIHRVFPGLILLLLLFPPETEPRASLAAAVLLAAAVGVGWTSAGLGRAAWMLALSAAAALCLFVYPWAPGLTAIAVYFSAFAVGASARDLSRTPGLLRAVQWSLVAVTCWVSVVALFQVTIGLDRLAEELRQLPALADGPLLLERAEEGRAFASFMTPAALGGFYALVLPALVGFAVAQRGWLRGFVLAVVVLGMAGLGASASATGVAALTLASALVLSVRWFSARSASRLSWKPTIAVIGLLAVMTAGLWVVRGPTLLDPAAGRGPLKLRLANYRASVDIVKTHPWVGVGPGGFVDAYTEVRLPGDNETRHVHNLPLESMVEWGVPVGLLASGAFFFLLLMPLLRSGQSFVSPAVAGIATGVAAFAIHNLADFTSTMPSLMWSCAILAGLVWGRTARSEEDQGPAALVPRWACATIVMLFCGILALDGLASEWTHRARYAEPGRPAADRLADASRAVSWAPWDVDAMLLASQLAMADSATVDGAGLSMADRAVRRAPRRAAAYGVRAQARISEGDLPGAYADLHRASELHPLEPGYREALVILAQRLGIPPPSDPVP